MKKLIIFLAILAVAAGIAVAQESYTLSTYYPAPNGFYRDMNVSNNIGVGTGYVTNRLGIGTTTLVNGLDVRTGLAVGSYAGVRDANGGLIVSGCVGIGTYSPGIQFGVQGSSKFTGPVEVTQNVTVTGNIGAGTADITGNLSIGNTGYAQHLHVYGDVRIDTYLIDRDPWAGVTGIGLNNRWMVNGLYSRSEGISIGTTASPGVGGLRMTGNANINGTMSVGTTTVNGNVSIGGTGYASHLHVYSDVRIDTYLIDRDPWPGVTGIGTNNRWMVNGLYSRSDGISIGTTADAGVGGLRMTGNLVANGTITSNNTMYAPSYLHLSDERLKNDIQPIEQALPKISRLNGVTFQFKDNKQRRLGVIAQNVEKVFPEAVTIDGDGYKTVDYDSLIAPVIEAIKSQQIRIDELEKRLEETEKKLQEK